jgi:hypothetical protein
VRPAMLCSVHQVMVCFAESYVTVSDRSLAHTDLDLHAEIYWPLEFVGIGIQVPCNSIS